jgi:hypothetical protein
VNQICFPLYQIDYTRSVILEIISRQISYLDMDKVDWFLAFFVLSA